MRSLYHKTKPRARVPGLCAFSLSEFAQGRQVSDELILAVQVKQGIGDLLAVGGDGAGAAGNGGGGQVKILADVPRSIAMTLWAASA